MNTDERNAKVAELNAREATLNEDIDVLRKALLKAEGERMNINREMRDLFAD